TLRNWPQSSRNRAGVGRAGSPSDLPLPDIGRSRGSPSARDHLGRLAVGRRSFLVISSFLEPSILRRPAAPHRGDLAVGGNLTAAQTARRSTDDSTLEARSARRKKRRSHGGRHAGDGRSAPVARRLPGASVGGKPFLRRRVRASAGGQGVFATQARTLDAG